MVPGDVAEDPAHRQVDAGQLVGGRVAFLAVDRDVVDPALMGVDELFRLHEEATGAAARVIDPARGRFQHLDQHRDDGFRGVEFAAALAFVRREFTDEIFIDPTDQVEVMAGAVEGKVVGEQLDQARHDVAAEFGPAIDLGQGVLERLVATLDLAHGIVNLHADVGGLGVGGQMVPAGLRRHPEYVFGGVFVGIVGISQVIGQELGPFSVEGDGNIAQEQQAQGDILVFTRIHLAAHLVSRREEGLLDLSGHSCPVGKSLNMGWKSPATVRSLLS